MYIKNRCDGFIILCEDELWLCTFHLPGDEPILTVRDTNKYN